MIAVAALASLATGSRSCCRTVVQDDAVLRGGHSTYFNLMGIDEQVGLVQWRSDGPRPNRTAIEAAIRNSVIPRQTLKRSGSALPPTFSVVIPSFNSGAFLERTLWSVASQEGGRTEIVVVDGGSTDGTPATLAKVRDIIDVLIVEPDNGQADAINKGIARTRGEWVGFLGADDLLLPGAIEAVAESARMHPEADLIFGDLLHVDSEENVIDAQIVLPGAARLFHFTAMQCHNQATFVRRSLLEKVGPLEASLMFCLDYEFFGRCLEQATCAWKVNQFIGAQRIHGATKTSNLVDVHDREKRMIQDRTYGQGLATLLRIAMPMTLRLRRMCHFLLHGQFWYLFRQVHRTW
jgi:GT2 family glycosyltransferase